MTTKSYNFETGVYRPPSEGGSSSLLVRFTRNCPWNYCTFCAMYKTEKFQLRSLEEIKADIDAMAALAGDLVAESIRLGLNGRITGEVISPAALFHKASLGSSRLVRMPRFTAVWLFKALPMRSIHPPMKASPNAPNTAPPVANVESELLKARVSVIITRLLK